MAKFQDKVYEQIGMNLALGMNQAEAVSRATGKDQETVSKYAYQIVKHDMVVAALAHYQEKFREKAYVEKDMLESEAAKAIFTEDLKPNEKLAYMRFIAELNGFFAKDKARQQDSDTKRGSAMIALANKVNGNVE